MEIIKLSHKNTLFRKVIWSLFYYVISFLFLYAVIFNDNATLLVKAIEMIMFLLSLFFGILCTYAVHASYNDCYIFTSGFIKKSSVGLSNISYVKRFFIYFYLLKIINNNSSRHSYIVFFASNNAMMTSTKEMELFKKAIRENIYSQDSSRESHCDKRLFENM